MFNFLFTSNKVLVSENNKLINIIETMKKTLKDSMKNTDVLLESHKKVTTVIGILDENVKTRDNIIKCQNETIDVLKETVFHKEERISTLEHQTNDYAAFLRTLTNFGGTLEQARELAAKAIARYESKESTEQV